MALFNGNLHPDLLPLPINSELEMKMKSYLEVAQQNKENLVKCEQKIREQKQRQDMKIQVTSTLHLEEKLINEKTDFLENQKDPFLKPSLATTRKINEFLTSLEGLKLKQNRYGRQALYYRRHYENCLKKKRAKLDDLKKARIHMRGLNKSTKRFRKSTGQNYAEIQAKIDKNHNQLSNYAKMLNCPPPVDDKSRVKKFLRSFLSYDDKNETEEINQLLKRQKKLKESLMAQQAWIGDACSEPQQLQTSEADAEQGGGQTKRPPTPVTPPSLSLAFSPLALPLPNDEPPLALPLPNEESPLALPLPNDEPPTSALPQDEAMANPPNPSKFIFRKLSSNKPTSELQHHEDNLAAFNLVHLDNPTTELHHEDTLAAFNLVHLEDSTLFSQASSFPDFTQDNHLDNPPYTQDSPIKQIPPDTQEEMKSPPLCYGQSFISPQKISPEKPNVMAPPAATGINLITPPMTSPMARKPQSPKAPKPVVSPPMMPQLPNFLKEAMKQYGNNAKENDAADVSAGRVGAGCKRPLATSNKFNSGASSTLGASTSGGSTFDDLSNEFKRKLLSKSKNPKKEEQRQSLCVKFNLLTGPYKDVLARYCTLCSFWAQKRKPKTLRCHLTYGCPALKEFFHVDHVEHVFRCNFCTTSFNDLFPFSKHVLANHGKNHGIICATCKTRVSLEEIKEHAIQEFEQAKNRHLDCSKCDFVGFPRDFIEHLITQHDYQQRPLITRTIVSRHLKEKNVMNMMAVLYFK